MNSLNNVQRDPKCDVASFSPARCRSGNGKHAWFVLKDLANRVYAEAPHFSDFRGRVVSSSANWCIWGGWPDLVWSCHWYVSSPQHP